MRRSLEHFHGSKGYTLIEVAIVTVVLGLLIVPATHIYTLYVKHQQAEITKTALLEARNSLANFRSIYGRYPCPAALNAVAGNINYGREARNATTGECEEVAGGITKASSNNAALSSGDVFIGALPFRQLNLPDYYVHDGYGNQLGYAITGLLTDDTTYNERDGGISIVGLDDVSIINPPDTAHFVILSHNNEDNGAITRSGTQVGVCPGTLEGENCNADAVFRSGPKTENFDDLIYFDILDGIELWQLSNIDTQDIHLRRSDSVVLGVDETATTGGFAEVEIRNTSLALTDGTMRVEADPVNALSGAVLTSAICEEAGVNCFSSKLIAGQISDGEGMDCSPGYLVGIANSVPICSNEITFSCPTGEFATGFDSNGQLRCSTLPPTECFADNIATTCGPLRTVNPFLYNGQYHGYGYAGECHKIADIDIVAIEGMSSVDEIRDYIDSVNNATRNTEDCGPDSSTAMTRDTFQCNDGVWDTTPVNTLERIDLNTSLASFDPLFTGGFYPAETSGPTYIPSDPMAVDANNANNHHDCWCREDYRVLSTDCSSGDVSGESFRIQKHSCPQSGSQWDQVYPVGGGVNSDFCPTCVEGPSQETQTCKSYFGLPPSNIGVTGNAVFNYNTTCPDGPYGDPVQTPDPDNPDLSNCTCPAQTSPLVTTQDCPFGETNSFEFDGVTYTGVAEIYHQDWVCPTGTPPVTPISDGSEAGYYENPQLVHTESCACDPTLVQPYYEACPEGFQGSGRHWVLPFNCDTGAFDPPSDDNLELDDCRRCIWQPGTPRGALSGSPTGVELGSPCPSCTGVASCYEVVGPDTFKIWDGCYCSGQP